MAQPDPATVFCCAFCRQPTAALRRSRLRRRAWVECTCGARSPVVPARAGSNAMSDAGVQAVRIWRQITTAARVTAILTAARP